MRKRHYEKITAKKVKLICQSAEDCGTCRYYADMPGGRRTCVFSLYVDASFFPDDLPCRSGKDAGEMLYIQECQGHTCRYCRHWVDEIHECDMTACEPSEWNV